MDFGHWLKTEIENREMTQAAFSDRSGISLPTLKRWLAQPCPPIRGVNIVRLAKALGLHRADVEARLHEAKTHRDDTVAA